MSYFPHSESVLSDEEVNIFLDKYNKRSERKCIVCSKKFISEGAHNRKCSTCKNKKSIAKVKWGHRDIVVHKSHAPGFRQERGINHVSDVALIGDLIMSYL